MGRVLQASLFQRYSLWCFSAFFKPGFARTFRLQRKRSSPRNPPHGKRPVDRSERREPDFWAKDGGQQGADVFFGSLLRGDGVEFVWVRRYCRFVRMFGVEHEWDGGKKTSLEDRGSAACCLEAFKGRSGSEPPKWYPSEHPMFQDLFVN